MNPEKPAPSYDPYNLDLNAVTRLIAVGLVTGVVGWLLYWLLANYFVSPIFCSTTDTFGLCKNGGTIAWISAHVVASVLAVIALAQLAVYRPLLVVIAALASLWSAHSWLGVLPWWQGLIAQGILFAIAFAVFGWIARVANFWLTVIVIVVLVVVARITLLYA